MKTLTYSRPNRLNHLHDELLDAGITPVAVLGRSDDIIIEVDDSVDSAAVDAVVNAHDVADWDLREQRQEAEDAHDRTALVDTVKTLTSSADWDGLTARQRTAVILALLRRLQRQ